METTRFADARRYEAPGHVDVAALRLQGMDATASHFAWVGLSHFLPGGAAEMAAGPVEKIYVVVAGEVIVELADGTAERLTTFDSCWIPAGEARAVRNDGNAVATMIVVMPHGEARP